MSIGDAVEISGNTYIYVYIHELLFEGKDPQIMQVAFNQGKGREYQTPIIYYAQWKIDQNSWLNAHYMASIKGASNKGSYRRMPECTM